MMTRTSRWFVVVGLGCVLYGSQLLAAPPEALPAKVESTLKSRRDHIKQCVLDGDAASYFASADNASKADHLTVKWDRPVALKSLEVLTGKPDGSETLTAGELQLSADGVKFENAAKFANGGAKLQGKGRKVQAVRVQPTADLGHPLAIREIKIESDPPVAVFKYPLEISIETNDDPDLQAWLDKVIRICEQSYPMLNEELRSDGFKPPHVVMMSLKNSYKGVAATSGDKIVGSVEYFKRHQDDVGAMVHELAHVVQAYRGPGNPGWLVEGVADYVRYYKFEPEKKRRINPNSAKYDGSYGTTAAFLNYVSEKHDRDIVKKLNQAMREGKYKESLFKDYTGKTVQELGAEWLEVLRAGK